MKVWGFVIISLILGVFVVFTFTESIMNDHVEDRRVMVISSAVDDVFSELLCGNVGNNASGNYLDNKKQCRDGNIYYTGSERRLNNKILLVNYCDDVLCKFSVTEYASLIGFRDTDAVDALSKSCEILACKVKDCIPHADRHLYREIFKCNHPKESRPYFVINKKELLGGNEIIGYGW